jgi:tRNA-splicing endonuclease subunit Sen34
MHDVELATIVHDPAAHRAPTPAQLEAWDASRRQDVAQHQLARLERQRRKDEERTMTTTTTTTAAPIDVAQGEDPTSTGPSTQTQKQKREAVGRRHRRPLMDADAAGADADAEADDADADAVTGTIDAIGGNRGGERALPVPAVPSMSPVYTVSVPTTSDAFAWYNYDYDDDDDDDGHDLASSSGPRQWHRRTTYETLDAARAAGVWSYPANVDERARCEVFRDLWEKGYYMGGGIKFGGDWLVYPGPSLSPPPSSFHSLSRGGTNQAIRCDITRTLLPLYKPPRLPRYARWKS